MVVCCVLLVNYVLSIGKYYVYLHRDKKIHVMKESFVIQSDMVNMPEVEERLFHFCRQCNVGNYCSAVSVATMQAVENAIVHGNQGDANKRVTITLGLCRGGIYAEVADEGKGFDHEKFGTLPTNDEVHGEGIFIMKQLADKLTFSDGGRRVRLEFEVAGIDPTDALQRIAVLQHRLAMVAA